MKVTVLYGGKSGERDVSRESASAVVRAMDVPACDITVVYITRGGEWFVQPEAANRLRADSSFSLKTSEAENKDENNRAFVVPGGGKSAFRTRERVLETDVVFPVLHGAYGEDGTAQGLFELAGVPYAGAGVLASALAMDKEKTKTVWQSAALPILPFAALRAPEWENAESRAASLKTIEESFPYPVFIKPARAGSSIGAGVAASSDEFASRADEAFRWDTKILIEPFISAREIECSVVGSRDPRAYVPGEIIPSHEFYDYDAKYIDSQGARLRIPAELDDKTRDKVMSLAVRAYTALECEGMARVDFFIDKNGGRLYLNEINTIPGFTSISMFPKMCAAGGLDFSGLIDKLLNLAISRFELKKSLAFENAVKK